VGLTAESNKPTDNTKMTTTMRLMCAAVLAMAFGPGVAAADPADDYETLFGKEERKVVASRTRDDDVKFAESLLKVARDVSDSPEMQLLLCEKILKFAAADVSGCDVRVETLALLETAAPDKKDQWRRKKLEVAQFRFTKSTGADKKTAGQSYMNMLEAAADAKVSEGDGTAARSFYNRARNVAAYLKSPRVAEIQKKSKRAGVVIAQQAKLKSLTAKLADDPKNASARKELIWLYVVEQDKPAKALELLGDGIDKATGKYVPLAVKEVSAVDEALCLELGQWYYSTLSRKASSVGKPLMLLRARRYYVRYLALFPKQGAKSYKANLAVKQIDKDLDRFGISVRRVFPRGILVALSFDKTHLTGASGRTVDVRNISGRVGSPQTLRIDGGKTGVRGKLDSGVSFPAASKGQLIIPSRVTANLKTFTFSFWVKSDEKGVGKTFWSQPTLLGFRTVGGGSRDFGVTTSRGRISYWTGLAGAGRDNSHQSGMIVSDGTWHHVALTNDGRKLMLYLDGKSVLGNGLASGATLGAHDVLLGASRSDIADSYGALNHSGTYDELQVYGRALSVEEIKKIAGKG